MATYKIVGDNPDEWQLVDQAQYEREQQSEQARHHQRQQQREEREAKMEMVAALQSQPQPMPQSYTPSDLMMPDSFNSATGAAGKHDVKVSATPEGQAKAFLMTFLYGLCPLYAILSAGIIWTATGTFNAPLWLLMVGLLGSTTWLGYAFLKEKNSPSGVEVHRISNRAKTEQMAIQASAEIAKKRMQFEQQMRLQEHQMKLKLLNGGVN